MGTVVRCHIRGVLAVFEAGFRDELTSLGYTSSSMEWKVNEASRLSRWMTVRRLSPRDLDDARLAEFFTEFAASRKGPTALGRFGPLLRFMRLRDGGVSDPVAEPGAFDGLLGSYREWMTGQRGLAARTMDRYETTARRFLRLYTHESADVDTRLGSLTARTVIDFLLAEAARGLSSGSLGVRACELRSLLRFLYVRGFVDAPLAGAVPPVPGWKGATVPPRMSYKQVQALLDSCDRTTVRGLRDFAMLILLARLGLRAAEVAGLRLEDLRWRDGEVVVRGKSRRTDRLPLPADVGDAVVQYLRKGRPVTEARTVFVTLVAPRRPLHPAAVSQTVQRQCRRAGLPPVSVNSCGTPTWPRRASTPRWTTRRYANWPPHGRGPGHEHVGHGGG